MKMRYIFTALALAAASSVVLTGCEESTHYYSGDEAVLFTDTVQMYAVTDDPNGTYKLAVGATKAYDYDHNLLVEVVPSKSTAIEGVHYQIESYNAELPAGQNVGYVNIKGMYDAIENTEGLSMTVDPSLEDPYVTLRIVDPKSYTLGYTETRVVLKKACPFNIDDFVVDGGFYYFYGERSSNTNKRLVRIDKVDDERLVIRNIYGLGRDLILNVREYEENPVIRQAVVFPQVVGIYDVLYPDITVMSVDGLINYIYPCTREMDFYLYAYVDGYGGIGYLAPRLKWISEEEAAKDKDYEDVKNY